ncbi:hypothetical protein NL393_31225, partial [Klebsiella pneumoniae]|nr:hypothetical protein [Klebsiella pneumoniae]
RLSQCLLRGKAQCRYCCSSHTARADFKKLSATDVHCFPLFSGVLLREETNSKILNLFARNQKEHLFATK